MGYRKSEFLKFAKMCEYSASTNLDGICTEQANHVQSTRTWTKQEQE